MVFPESEWLESAPEQQGLDPRKLQEAMEVIRRISGAQGNSQSVVIRNGYLIWRGPDIDHLHTVWSCTKSFLSTVLGLLVDDGRCTLETRAADVYPALAEHYPTVTLRHLATFVSGYRAHEASREVPPFEPAAPLFAPGEKFHYSWDPYLLALVLTKVAGRSLDELFRRRIAEPIGLDPATWHWGDWGTFDYLTGLPGVAVCGGSGLYDRGVGITARAMARVGWLFACGGLWNGRQLISRAWVEQATRPQVPATVPPYDPQAWYGRLPGRYGLYWWTNGADSSGRRMWPAAPERTFAMQGNMDNFCFVIPEWRMVVVRLGMDGQISNDRYDEFFGALRRAFIEKP
ncbi:MAG: serine hydrolase [Anaerolineaceae bacterium]|nr:serine hydrolase [Anaerolineaceae bacterium]